MVRSTRSRRGRSAAPSKRTDPRLSIRSAGLEPSPQPLDLMHSNEIPEVESEEVLNKRGMPARKKKRNSFYDDMITPVTPAEWKAKEKARNSKKLKEADKIEEAPSLPTPSPKKVGKKGKKKEEKPEVEESRTVLEPDRWQKLVQDLEKDREERAKMSDGRSEEVGYGFDISPRKVDPVKKGGKKAPPPKSTPTPGQLLVTSGQVVRDGKGLQIIKNGPVFDKSNDSKEKSQVKAGSSTKVQGPKVPPAFNESGGRLRNLLRLPRAHKWVCYEWFYSDMDKVIFDGENDFQICLRDQFPNLKTTNLTRTEWTKIRQIMGKPRRFSEVFLEEERLELSKKRERIRQVQQRKPTNFSYKELPDEIPLQLVIGTKVTARLRRPHDGLYAGTVEGADTSNNTYRITFERPGVGTHSIPDYEVKANLPPDTFSMSSFSLRIPRFNKSLNLNQDKFKLKNPDLFSEQLPFPADGMLGGFPVRLLDMIVRLSKLLKVKWAKLKTLKELNVEGEKLKSYEKPFNSDYKSRYAHCVLDLDFLNKTMGTYVEVIQAYCSELQIPTNTSGDSQPLTPEQILEKSRNETSAIMFYAVSDKPDQSVLCSKNIAGLIHKLGAMLLQVREFATVERNRFELQGLKDTIRDMKASLDGKNLQCFEDKIELPMNRIMAGLCVPKPKKDPFQL